MNSITVELQILYITSNGEMICESPTIKDLEGSGHFSFYLLYHNLLGRTEEGHVHNPLGQSVSGSRFEPGFLKQKARHATTLLRCQVAMDSYEKLQRYVVKSWFTAFSSALHNSTTKTVFADINKTNPSTNKQTFRKHRRAVHFFYICSGTTKLQTIWVSSNRILLGTKHHTLLLRSRPVSIPN